MTDDSFWSLLEQARKSSRGDQDAMCDALQELLRALPPDEVVAFDLIFHNKVVAAHNWNLWGAAYLQDGGCSDDGFEYFRRWLVAMGRDAYHAALKDPDSLAMIKPALLEEDYHSFERIVEPARAVHEEQTGEDFIEHADAAIEGKPQGQNFNFDDQAELKARYPRLWKKFGR